jgi:hypothetical protein
MANQQEEPPRQDEEARDDIPQIHEDEEQQPDFQPVEGEEEEQEEQEEQDQQELNVELYEGLMASINSLWADFDIESGFINFADFKIVMKAIAQDQGVYDGNADESDQTTIFFTEENITHIFDQILEHEKEQKAGDKPSDEITHSSVVDILYNVLNQINEQRNDDQD